MSSDKQESIASGFWPRTRMSLILRLQDADQDDPRREQNWEEFLHLYAGPVSRYCRRRLRSVEEAEEVTHLVFVKIFKSLPRFRYDPDRGRFGGWVGTIARHEIIRFIHKQQRAGQPVSGLEFSEILSSAGEAAWVDEFNENLIRLAFERVRNTVSAENWRLFEASWKSRKKPGEVAKDLGVSSSRVYKARFIVSGKLKDVIQKISDDIPLPGDTE